LHVSSRPLAIVCGELMKKWNTTGNIKAAIVAVCVFLNLIAPVYVQPQQGLILTVIMPLLFGSIAIPLITKSTNSIQIVKPTWNDNPLIFKKPLSLFHFGVYFFIAIGVSVVVGAGIKYRALSHIGLMSVSYGLGILIGIYLALLSVKKK